MFSSNITTTKTLNNIKKSLRERLITKYKFDDENITDEILSIHGLDKNRFDFINSVENVINDRINDVSVDANSNKNEKTISGIYQEATIPVKKAVGFDYLYRQMKKIYGREEAKRLMGEMMDLSLGLSDSSNIMLPYCYAINASNIVVEGRPFGQLHSAPAKRVSSYISALCETVHQLSSHFAGAIAVSTMMLDIAHLSLYNEDIDLRELKTNKKYRKKLENEFQQFVHSLNHLSRNSNESPFSNISIFDKEKLKVLIEEMSWYFPFENLPIDHPSDLETDEEKNEFYMNYIIDYITEIQNIFLDFFDKGDPLRGGMPYRFPVVTACISKKKWGDREIINDPVFVKNICKRDVYRYNIFVSEGTKIASCCLRGDQNVLIRHPNTGTILTNIENVITTIPNNGNTSLFHNGFWKKYKKVQVPYYDDWYKIETNNGKQIVCTKDHIHPTLEGNKQSCELSESDYLLFNTQPFKNLSSNQHVKHSDKKYDYNKGYLIGCFLGDGSYQSVVENDKRIYRGVVLSLNKNCIDEIKHNIEPVVNQFQSNMHFDTSNNNVHFIRIDNTELSNWLLKYVPHNIAPNKCFDDVCFGASYEFRRGIIDGLLITDGNIKTNRIYTTSEKLINQIECLCTMLGMCTDISVSDRRGVENVVIRGEKFNRNYILRCVRIYKNKNADIKYKHHNNSIYFKIKSITKIKNTEGVAYCFEIKNDFPYFTLPNGMITHNCRLINDTDMLELGAQSNSFGAGGSISLGSHRVCTINFMRVALEANTKEEFYQILENRLEDTAKILSAHKSLIKQLTDQGLLPFIKNGWVALNRLFSTFGILGLHEAAILYEQKIGKCGDIQKDILVFMNKKVNEFSKKYNISGNLEQIPAESFAVRLAKVDKLLFGEELVPYQMYANQFIPLWKDATIWERMEVDGQYNKLITGGGICHAMISEKVTGLQAEKLIKHAVNVGCQHFALNSVYSQCEQGHCSFGKHEICPECGEKIVDCLTRVVGFFVPVSSWEKTRREWEFPKRTFVQLPKDND